MATSRQPSARFKFELPVYLETEDRANITPEGVEGVCRYLSIDISWLNKHLQRVDKLHCVCISSITVREGRLVFQFILENIEELEEFYDLSSRHVLSTTFTKYTEDNCLQIQAGFDISTKLKCITEMDEETYKKALLFFEGTDTKGKSVVTGPFDRDDAQQDNHGNDTGSNDLETQFIMTEMIMALPQLKSNEKLDSVTLNVRDLNISSGELLLQMEECRYGLMSARVPIPITSHHEKIEYDFTIKVAVSGIFRNTYDSVKSNIYKMKASNVIREFFNHKGVLMDDFANHCKHIIIVCSANLSLIECAIQIEDLCHAFKIIPKAFAINVFNCLFSEVDKTVNYQLLLSMVLFGNLFQSYFFIANTVLKRDTSHTLLNSLRQYKSTDLPGSCSSYMFTLANDLCKVALGKNYCFLTFVDAVYPFFEEKQISDKLIQTIRNRDAIVSNEVTSEIDCYCLNLFENICERINCENAKLLLEQLLRNMPVRLAIKVYNFLKSKESTAIIRQANNWKMVQDSLIGVIKSQLSSAKKNAEELTNIAQRTEECPDLAAVTRADFEKAIMQCISNANRKELELLKSLVFNENLFTSEEQQVDLIKCLTKLRHPELHFLLFELLSNAKFREAFPKADSTWFFECFDNAFLQFKRGVTEEQRLKDVYCYLSKVNKVPVLKLSENLSAYLDKIAVDYLKQSDLKKVMKMISNIEELSEKDFQIGMLFKTHVKTLLNEYYANYYEVLMHLCGTNGELRINSSVTASIVNTIITLCTPKSAAILEQFKEVISQCALWKTVMRANGKEVTRVRENKCYRNVVECLERMVKILQDGDILYGYLGDATSKTNKDDAIEMLTLISKAKRVDVKRYWNEIECCFESELKKITCSCSILKEIQNRILNENESPNVKATVSKLNALRQDILMGAINAGQLKSGRLQWDEVEKLSSKCLYLQEYVTSDIFWNSCATIVKTEFEEECKRLDSEEHEREAFESIHSLFGEFVTNKTKDEADLSEIVLLLEILTNKGIIEYKQAWSSLMKDQDKDVSNALTLLTNVDVDKEIRHAENTLRQPITNSLKNTLRRLKHINRYDDVVDAIKKCLHVFGIPADTSKELHDAISTFENLKEKSESCTFSAVVKSLEKIDSFANELQPETIEILGTLSDSSSLIEFLRKIVEEDIRNLIDAVEDISEQHVQESTVSALIEVKSFLHGLLIRTPKELSAQEFLDTLNKQTKAISTSASKLPAKIDECMNSLHNLISLYGNVANRGEMTAEIIGNTISKGKFKFELDKDGVCEFYATYKHGSIREKQTKMTLIDLRSRALLLMNTRTKVHDRKIRGQDLEKFVSYVDLCIEIGDLIDELHQSGDMDFITYSIMKDCPGLIDLEEQLHQRKMEWNRTLQSLREEFYLLNFIRGPEIHLLYNCFDKNAGHANVEALLRYIHPDLQLDLLLDSYTGMKGSEKSMSNEEMLRCFGRVLHLGYEGKHPIERQFPFKSQSQRLTEMVQNRHLFVAALEEHSNQVVKTLLALYMNTTQTLPEPHQVLFCTKDTTWNELELLLYRCFGSFKFSHVRQLFCIANVEMLSNELQFKLVEKLKNIDTNENYLLSLICRGSGKHPFLDELSSVTNKTSILSDEQLRQAFQAECPCVVTYTSTVPGLGKSSNIKKRAITSRKAVVTLHLSGPLRRRNVIERLSSSRLQKHHALHIDIGSVDNVVDLDTFIFELIILRYVTTSFMSFSLETDFIYIEVANTINDSLRNSLNTVMAFKREHLKWEDYSDFFISMEVNSPVQVVCQYLNCLEKGLIDRKDLQFGGNKSESVVHPNQCRRLLRKYFGQDGDLSYTVVNIFIYVLADQLKKMACSSFFRVSRLLEMTGHKTEPVVRSTLLVALIEASKEFSSRSIKNCRSTQMSTVGTRDLAEDEAVSQVTDTYRLADLANQTVDAMIRWEDSNHLIFVFHSQNIQTISPMYRDLEMVPHHVKSLFESQMKRGMQDFNSLSQNELLLLLQKVARTNPLPLCQNTIQHLNAEYALTPDNLLKMVLIMLRVKSHIPVVVMGETGCGKTSLIRYLATVSDVEFEVLSIHAGVEEDKILQTISQNDEKAFSCPETERWLFLDEINTSEHIGVMGDAICSRQCLGKVLAPNLIVMGACNPYKLRTESAISTAGLKGKIQTDELSKLVYRVLPLPERLVDYVWDFGTLSDKDEAVYIRRMIDDVFPGNSSMLKLLQDLLSASQTFVRELESVSYCVSLRDVQRCKVLIKWFVKILPRKVRKHNFCYDVEIKAIILALAICYHSRFSSNKRRLSYRKELQMVFSRNNRSDLHADRIKKTIVEEQKDILGRMDLPTGTAKNTALQENVFVILVCLLNKIPIFLVGKPGCSKSLSMQVIRSNLRGKDSKDPFFKSLPQLYCVSFQGSESSTSDGIIKVFEKAIKYQESNSAEEVLSVVILDEIGLAEVSKFNPLKVLHSLLEPDGRQQPDVAVVGISNWALDASKMNRGIHLSRPDMDEEELYQTGVSISESFIDSKQQQKQNRFNTSAKPLLGKKARDVLKDIAMSYLKYVDKLTFKHFHGLRDYYSLVKFISRGLLDVDVALDDVEKDKIVFRGLQRNFGGLPAESATLLNMFQIQANSDDLEATNVLKLMEDNIIDQLARHLMCITSGDSVMSLVESLLTEMHREEKVVIFGSHFEEDQTADYNYRILSRIILCMEQGFVLILKDLENIYGSLYDMLNQNYTVIGKKKHCRVALGHYSNPICHVHDSFRCIVLVDESKVDYSDPPFLNRFEKQYLRFTDTVDKLEAELIGELGNWANQFTSVLGCSFDESDCFPIYSQDMIPSLVIKTCRASGETDKPKDIFEICKTQLLHIVQPDAIFRLENSSSAEMRKDAKRIRDEYLKLPVHRGIWHFIDDQMKHSQNRDLGLLTIVLTNSSIHSQDFYKHKKSDVQVEKLGAFKSEKQLHLRIQKFWTEASESILFLHCSATEDEKHISLAKATIDNIRADVSRGQRCLTKHVYFIIHLDRRRAETKAVLPINYLSGWEIVVLDSINEPELPLTELFTLSLHEAVQRKRPLTKYITEQLFWSFSRIRYQIHGRELYSIQRVIEKMQVSEDFLHILEERVCDWINTEFKGKQDTEWLNDIALNTYAMNTYSSFLVALEQDVLKVIREPMCKLIYQLENMNIISCYFCEAESHTRERKESLEKMLRDENYFSISCIHDESGPECYLCIAADVPLRMPFSKLMFDKVEETKDDFMESYLQVKEKCDLDDDDEMPTELLEVLFSKHEGVVEQILPDLSNYIYGSLCDDYFHDFCHFVSYAIPSKLTPLRRYQIIRWALEREISLQTNNHIELIVKLHASYWIFAPALSAEYQLFETCSEVINMEEPFLQFLGHQNSNYSVSSPDLGPCNILDYLDPEENAHTYIDSKTEVNVTPSPKNTNRNSPDNNFAVVEAVGMYASGDIPILEVSTENEGSETEVSTENPQDQILFQHTADENYVGSNEIVPMSNDLPEVGLDRVSLALSENEATHIIVAEEKSDEVDVSRGFIPDVGLPEVNNNIEVIDLINVPKESEEMHLTTAVSDSAYQAGLASLLDDQSVKLEKCLTHTSTEIQSRVVLRTTDIATEEETDCIFNLFQGGQISAESETEKTVMNEVDCVSVLAQHSDQALTGEAVMSAGEMEDKMHSLLGQKVTRNTDSRKQLVEFVSTKLLPNQSTLDVFESIEVWQKRVSSVLTNALKISSEPGVLHYLRFCYDLVSVLGPHLQQIKWVNVMKLGDILRSNEKSVLDSPECFETVCELLFTDPKLPAKDANLVICSYLNRCLAADVDTQALIYFLQLVGDQHIIDEDFDIFKPPLHLALNLDIVENDDNVFCNLISISSDVELEEYPFLHALDETLKGMMGTVYMDSHFAVLIVDILEDIFNNLLPELLKSDTDYLKEVLLSVQNIILSNEYGLQFLVAISFYKSFTKYFASLLRDCNFDISKCMLFLQVVKAIVDKESENSISLSMKRFFVRELGKGMLPWTLYKTCDILAETFDFLKSWHWKENYLYQCLEGNPLLRYAPKQVQHLEEIFRQKELGTQREMLQEVFKMISDKTVTLAVCGIGLAKFYIARSYKQQDDTFNQLAESMVRIAEEENMDGANVQFLACLLGVHIFPGLELNERSDEILTITAMFSTSLFAIILASNKRPFECDHLSLLAKCLLCPFEVNISVMSSLRGLCNRESKIVKMLKERDNLCSTCSCGYRVFSKSNANGQQVACPICAQNINKYHKQSETLRAGNAMRGPALQNSSPYLTAEAEVAKTLIHLCVHACLFGSLTLDLSNTKDMERVTGISEVDNIPDTLMDTVQKDFSNLQRLMNMNCRDLYIFLQACLLNLKDLLCEDKKLITTEEHVIVWAEKFEWQIKHLIQDRYGSILHTVQQQSDSLQIKCEGPELSVNENDHGNACSEVRKQFLPSLFRVQGQSDFASFELDLHVLENKEHHPHPFLLFVLEVLPELTLTEHLLNIVRWHIATVAQIEYRMKRRQCLEMTIEDFIHYDKNENIRNRLKDRFERLQESLTLIMDKGHRFEILSCRMTSQTKMKDCLILNSESILHKVITELVTIQNKFIDTTLQISVETDCRALEFLSKGQGVSAIPCTNLSEIKASSIVTYHWDDELLKFSHADLRYGYGAQMKYEFQAIEKMLALKLVAGKPYILQANSLPFALFVDEFYKGYGNMAIEISKIIPQKPLTLDVIHGIKDKREKHPRLTVELITHVGVLISLAKKTKGDPMMPVIEYVETWKNVLTSPLPSNLLPAPENSVKLCHLIALYGLLEELNADSLVDSLDDEYRKSLSFDIKSQLNGLLRSNQKLAEMMLKATKRFTYRCLSSGEADSTQPLSEYLADESFWPCDVSVLIDTTGDDYPKTPIQYIPEDLKVHHVYEVISFIGNKLKDLSDKDVTLSLIATSFASRGGRTKTEKKRKLAQKRIV